MTMFTLEILFSSGQKMYAHYTPESSDTEPEEVQQAVEDELRQIDRAFTSIGDLIVHTGAVSAVRVLA